MLDPDPNPVPKLDPEPEEVSVPVPLKQHVRVPAVLVRTALSHRVCKQWLRAS